MTKRILAFSGGILLLGLVLFLASVGLAALRLEKNLGHRFEWDESLLPTPSVPYEDRTITTADGLQLSAWYIAAAQPKALVVMLHGFEAVGGKAQMIPMAEFLYKNGYSSLLVNARAYGESEGEEVTLGVQEWQDAEAAYDMLAALPENQNVPVGFLGVSMGASTAIITAGHTGKGDFVIADVPFANYGRAFSYQAGKQGFGWMSGIEIIIRVAAYSALGRDYPQFNPDRLVANIHVPILISWSDEDEVIGPNQGSVLFERANEPKMAFESSVGHLILTRDWERFSTAVLEFLNEQAAQ